MMTMLLRVILIIASLFTMVFIVKRIRASRMQIEDTLFWLFFSVILVLFALFPVIPDTLASILGIYSTANFLFSFFIFVLLIKVFMMSIRISQLENKIREMTQKIAIDNNLSKSDKED